MALDLWSIYSQLRTEDLNLLLDWTEASHPNIKAREGRGQNNLLLYFNTCQNTRKNCNSATVLEKQKLLPEEQAGFRSTISTSNALKKFFQDFNHPLQVLRKSHLQFLSILKELMIQSGSKAHQYNQNICLLYTSRCV